MERTWKEFYYFEFFLEHYAILDIILHALVNRLLSDAQIQSK